jgi:CDP-4-dehydro-6-deoxyglucose reductase
VSQALTVSRAAHLVGVPRGVLQRMIRAGELRSHDGLLDTDELLRAFPQVRLEDAGALEQVTRIREHAFGRRVSERALPSPEVLAQRLFAQSRELAEVRRHLQAYHALVAASIERLEAAAAGSATARELRDFLEAGLARVLASEPDNPLDAMTDMLKVVSANVLVRPSGREFLVEGSDSLLQAALKAGLRLAYGCGGGTCGLCKARVVSGEVRRIGHADYALSAAEQQQGYVLTCTHTALGDLVIETLEAAGPADIPEQQLVAKLRAVTPLAADTLLVHLQTPRSDRLRFLAGQSVTLGLATADGDVQATYPLASCPCDDRNLLFHVARDPADPLATRLFAGEVGGGAAVNVRGPFGEFVLGPETGVPLIFVACDTGFAPVRSLIEHAIAAEAADVFRLHWVATRADGHYQAGQGKAWAAAFDDFAFAARRAGDPATGAADALGAVTDDPALAEGVCYVAGPAAFVEALAAGLRAAGLPAARLHTSVV